MIPEDLFYAKDTESGNLILPRKVGEKPPCSCELFQTEMPKIWDSRKLFAKDKKWGEKPSLKSVKALKIGNHPWCSLFADGSHRTIYAYQTNNITLEWSLYGII